MSLGRTAAHSMRSTVQRVPPLKGEIIGIRVYVILDMGTSQTRKTTVCKS